MPKNTKYMLRLPMSVEATGDPWKPDDKKPATVPIPNAVIITSIEGPYTERDRKLWTFLVHAVWDELLIKRYHEIPVNKIDKLFRELESGHDGHKWIWESARRLSKTIVEWEEGPDTNRLKGISCLMTAKTNESEQATGILWFQIPDFLAEVIKKPFRFSRIRLHFMIGLSGKYAVTLYEILEGAVNLKSPTIEIELSNLRKWLKIPEGKLVNFYDLKRRVLEPSLTQINNNPDGAGFAVTMEPIKKGRAVDRIRFSLIKTESRLEKEKKSDLVKNVDEPPSLPSCSLYLPTSAYEKAKKAAPGYDIYSLENEWREWMQKTGKKPENHEAAFIAFCRHKDAQKSSYLGEEKNNHAQEKTKKMAEEKKRFEAERIEKLQAQFELELKHKALDLFNQLNEEMKELLVKACESSLEPFLFKNYKEKGKKFQGASLESIFNQFIKGKLLSAEQRNFDLWLKNQS